MRRSVALCNARAIRSAGPVNTSEDTLLPSLLRRAI